MIPDKDHFVYIVRMVLWVANVSKVGHQGLNIFLFRDFAVLPLSESISEAQRHCCDVQTCSKFSQYAPSRCVVLYTVCEERYRYPS